MSSNIFEMQQDENILKPQIEKITSDSSNNNERVFRTDKLLFNHQVRHFLRNIPTGQYTPSVQPGQKNLNQSQIQEINQMDMIDNKFFSKIHSEAAEFSIINPRYFMELFRVQADQYVQIEGGKCVQEAKEFSEKRSMNEFFKFQKCTGIVNDVTLMMDSIKIDVYNQQATKDIRNKILIKLGIFKNNTL